MLLTASAMTRKEVGNAGTLPVTTASYTLLATVNSIVHVGMGEACQLGGQGLVQGLESCHHDICPVRGWLCRHSSNWLGWL